jgi:hypothetical protein
LVRCVEVEFGVCTYTCFHVSKKRRNIFLHAMAYNNRAMGTLFLTLGLVFFSFAPRVLSVSLGISTMCINHCSTPTMPYIELHGLLLIRKVIIG